VTPGEAELAERELELAEEALRETSVLLEARSLRGSLNRLYYGAFHAARAALTVRGLYAKTHSGQIVLFGQTYGEDPLLGRLLELRLAADYAREALRVTSEDIRGLLEETETFVARCREIVREALREGPDEPDPPPDY
jgi:uncharacterized protein (UPF0332 family)